MYAICYTYRGLTRHIENPYITREVYADSEETARDMACRLSQCGDVEGPVEVFNTTTGDFVTSFMKGVAK